MRGRTVRRASTEVASRQSSQKSTPGTAGESSRRRLVDLAQDVMMGRAVIETRLLSPEQERLRGELRAALRELEAAVVAVGASDEDRGLIGDALRGLDELFLLVVIGEFNAG